MKFLSESGNERKVLLLLVVTVALLAATFMMPRLAQDPAYHLFADSREWMGIPNTWNVLSNIPFVIVGGYGLFSVATSGTTPILRRIYCLVFLGIVLTGVGSAWYHLSPDNDRLVYDRLPMVIIFMSFLAAVLASWVGERWAERLVLPLLLLGVGSVLWWHHTEVGGNGDLRLYGFVQFYPMVLTPVLLLMQKRDSGLRFDTRRLLLWVVFWYLLAKAAEHWDELVFHTLGFMSGHSLKHLLSSIACLYICLYFRATYGRRPHRIT